MRKLIYKVKLIIRRIKTKNKMIGKEVKLIKCAPSGKPTSGNSYIGTDNKFVITSSSASGAFKTYNISLLGSCVTAGWVYEYEIQGAINVSSINEEIKELEEKISCLKAKVEWMNEVGAEEYDEDEFKVYETLKTLQNDELSLKDKTKLIASLIKGGGC